VPLVDRAETFEERVAALTGELDVGGTRRVWDRALAAEPWSEPPVWLHGDLHPANVLIHRGTIEAIIDFGDLCAGDPATDLAAAWMLLPASVIEVFEVAYGGFGVALRRRSLAWAVLFALMLLEIGLNGRATYETVGRATLKRAIAHSDDAS
jgi:aminoglycoside phosphotransferase (APT) family kinase protein